MDALSAQLLAQGFLKAPLDASPQTALQELSQATQSLLAHWQLASSRHGTAYDLERAMKESHRAKEAAAALEKARQHDLLESKQAKSDLQTERRSHLVTREEFQKTKLALQYVKSVAETERKRKEREMAEMVSKLVAAPSGTANCKASIARALPHGPRCDDGPTDLLEVALKDLEEVRQALVSENEKFREAWHGIIQQQEQVVRDAGATPAQLSFVIADAHLHPQPHLTLPPDDLALFASSLVRQLSDALEGASQARSDAQVEADEAQATLARERLERQEHESACSKEIGELTAEIDLSRRRISELQSQLAAQAVQREADHKQARKDSKALKRALAASQAAEEKLKAQEGAFKQERTVWETSQAKEKASARQESAAQEAAFERLVPASISTVPKTYAKAKLQMSTPAPPAAVRPDNPVPPPNARIASHLANVLFDSPAAPVPVPAARPSKTSQKVVLADKVNKLVGDLEAKESRRSTKPASTRDVAQERKPSAGKLRFQAALAKVEGR